MHCFGFSRRDIAPIGPNERRWLNYSTQVNIANSTAWGFSQGLSMYHLRFLQSIDGFGHGIV